MYGYNPGLKIPKPILPPDIEEEIESFIASESSPEEARARDVAEAFGGRVSELIQSK